ncbi:hypothetical protein ACRARG_12185 [Pseudooceanicola sp. C21-150M6]|uniref:hypothetical protein n=1 Tax=Pseudooceanicola sp. C21-150M6 TaxID=3434355 RepID=UPI003D7F8FF2
MTERIAAHWRRAREEDISPLDDVWQRELRALHSERMSELRNRADEEWHDADTIPIEEADRRMAAALAEDRALRQQDRERQMSQILAKRPPKNRS